MKDWIAELGVQAWVGRVGVRGEQELRAVTQPHFQHHTQSNVLLHKDLLGCWKGQSGLCLPKFVSTMFLFKFRQRLPITLIELLKSYLRS